MTKTPLSQYSRFFWPIALQAASQSLTYPLVAIVASNGKGGPLALAGLAQSNTIMFLLGTLGASLISTGLVYARTKTGQALFVKLNYIICFIVVSLQSLLCIPVLSHWIFGIVMGLPPGIETPARLSFLASIPMHILFFMRNPAQVSLYVNKSTSLATAATFSRIGVTIALAPLFCFFGLTGIFWAVVCQTIGAATEVVCSNLFARKSRSTFPDNSECRISLKELFAFSLTLSLGGLFMNLSNVTIGMVIARADRAAEMLSAYYLAAGLAGPMAFAATRTQALAITFPRNSRGVNSTLLYGLWAGLFMGFVPLIFILPGIGTWYYVTIQNLSPGNMNLVRLAAFAMVLNPLSAALRAHTEGESMVLKKPATVLAGQGAYLGILACFSIALLFLKVPGVLIAPVSFFCANLSASAVMYVSLYWERKSQEPIFINSSREGT